MKGYVYVLSNDHMPGVYKVGRSKDGGRARAAALYTTGVPTPFVVEFEMLAADCVLAESEAHELLSEHRVNAGREFFKAELVSVIEAVCSSVMGEWHLACVPEDYGDLSCLGRIEHFAGVSPAPAGLEVIQHFTESEIVAAGKRYHEHQNRLLGKTTLTAVGES